MDELLNTFLEALPLPVVGVDRRGRVILWSGAAEAVLGWTAAEVMGNRSVGQMRTDFAYAV